MDADRRELLKQAAALMAGFTLARCKPEAEPAKEQAGLTTPDAATKAAQPAQPIEHAFQGPQRTTLEMTCARLLPSDQDPGAKEANAIEYIDRELARPEYEKLKKAILAGTVALDRVASRLGGRKFAQLNGDEQDDVIDSVQKQSERGRDFVKLMTLLTIEGFVSDPMYGGNARGVGWDFIGYGPGRHEH